MWFARLVRVVPLERTTSRQLCLQFLGVANEMLVVHLLVELHVILQVITRKYHPFTTSHNQSHELKGWSHQFYHWYKLTHTPRPVEKLINFNMTCLLTFHTNSLLHRYLFLVQYTNNSEQKKMGTFYMDSLLYDECPHIQWSWVMITLIILMNCILNDIATCSFLFQWLCLHLTVTNNSCQVWLCTKKVQTLL